MSPGGSQGAEWMAMGKGGQISNDTLVGVLEVQTTVRFRRSGDAKMTCRHRRHTWTNGSHHNKSDEDTSLQWKNIGKRASSGRMSIVDSPTIYPSAHQRSLPLEPPCEKTYFDSVRSAPPSNVRFAFPCPHQPNGHLSESKTRACYTKKGPGGAVD